MNGTQLILCLFLLSAISAIAGCNGAKPASLKPPEVDADAAAAAIVKEFDKDGNGSLSKEELASFPPIAAVWAAYDLDGDQALSSDEIVARLSRLYSSTASLTGVQCTVTFAGRPLEGAKVVFRPAAMLGDAVKPAEGVTDELGVASPTLASAELPDNLKNAPLMYPGLYHVEITHPHRQIPSKYNTATELGCEIDPISRTGTSPRFDLKQN